MLDLPLEIIVSVGAARLCVHELMSLKRDQIVSLDKRVCDPVDIFVGERLVARGELVDLDGEEGGIGVRVTDIAGMAKG
ncbi:MAG: FliM/FliN family flagellar motor switch protein [Parvularculaceae bacterium]